MTCSMVLHMRPYMQGTMVDAVWVELTYTTPIHKTGRAVDHGTMSDYYTRRLSTLRTRAAVGSEK